VLGASNKATTYIAGAVVGVGIYFGMVYVPIYSDNAEVKQMARSYAASARWENEEEKARINFLREVNNLGLKFTEETCRLERTATTNRVACEYTRNAEFPLVNKKKPMKFSWTVSMKLR